MSWRPDGTEPQHACVHAVSLVTGNHCGASGVWHTLRQSCVCRSAMQLFRGVALSTDTLATSTLIFDDCFTPWQLRPLLSTTVAQLGSFHLDFRIFSTTTHFDNSTHAISAKDSPTTAQIRISPCALDAHDLRRGLFHENHPDQPAARKEDCKDVGSCGCAGEFCRCAHLYLNACVSTPVSTHLHLTCISTP